MTYRELEEAANRLAHVLAGHGVGPGGCVGLLVPRSAQAVVAILAVLKTGAAYVPIDPGLPAARIGFMVADAAPIGCAHHQRVGRPARRARSGGHRYQRSRASTDPARHGAALPGAGRYRVSDLHLGHHRGAQGGGHHPPQRHPTVGVIGWLTAWPGRVWAQCHSLAFDSSVWEIWGALLHGGRLVVVPEAVARSPEDFHAVLVAEQVSVLTQTPSAVGVLSPQGLGSVALVVAGEACPVEVVDRWAPGRVMINGYGPTETTVCACGECAAGAGVGGAADWFPGVGGGVVCAGWVVACGAGGCGGGVVCGRCWGGCGVLAPGGVDGVAVCGVPVRGFGSADVSHRGFGAVGR